MSDLKDALIVSKRALVASSTLIEEYDLLAEKLADLEERTLSVLSACDRTVSLIDDVLSEEPIEPEPSEPEPVDPPPSVSFVALDCLGNSAQANKQIRMPQLRASRAPRESVGWIGDVRANEYEQGGMEKSDLESVPGPANQWSHNLHKGQLVERTGIYRWDNIGITGEHWALKWGTREYNAPDREFVNCDFTLIPQEHGLYVSNSRDTTLTGCTFYRCGSQGAQFAHRELPYQQYDADNMPYRAVPVHQVTDCHFVDCGVKGTRPSFTLTYFDPGNSRFPGELTVKDCSFVAQWSEADAGSKGNRSTGAFVITPSQGNPPLEPSWGQMMHYVGFENCLFDYTKGDRAVGVIRSCDQIEFKDCCFISRDHQQGRIDIDSGDYLQGTKSGQIVIENCVADATYLRVFVGDGTQGNVPHSLHCPGERLVIDGKTGQVISRVRL